MSREKAIICTALLAIVLIILIFIVAFAEEVNGVSIYTFVTSCITGSWLAEKVFYFYDWLRKKR